MSTTAKQQTTNKGSPRFFYIQFESAPGIWVNYNNDTYIQIELARSVMRETVRYNPGQSERFRILECTVIEKGEGK